MPWQLIEKTIESGMTEAIICQEAYNSLYRRDDVGFFRAEIVSKAIASMKEVFPKAADLDRTLHIVGIGGSALGAQALLSVVAPGVEKNNRIIVHDNVDATTFEAHISKLSKETISKHDWLVVSKSGGTIETLANYNMFHQVILENFNFDITKNTIVITEFKESPLYNWANNNSVPILEVPKTVGGRFSAFTCVGLAPLAWLGVDLSSVQKAFDNQAGLGSEVCELANYVWNSMQREENVTYLLPYTDSLKTWGAWLQQLWAESLGKKKQINGHSAPPASTPVVGRGVTDQHSILQQIVEGTYSKFVIFLELGSSENSQYELKSDIFSSGKLPKGMNLGQLMAAELAGTRESLKQNEIPSITIREETLNLETLTELMLLFELVVGTVGELLNIDAFDQPGVELGKVLTAKYLAKSVLDN